MISFRPSFKRPSCPDGWEITRALSQPETGADVVDHLRSCPSCAQLATELRAAMSAAAEMPSVEPLSQAARDRIRVALSEANVEAIPSSNRRRLRLTWAFVGGLAGMAAGLCGWISFHSPKPRIAQPLGESAEAQGGDVSLAKVRAFGGAKFRRLSGAPDETVRLESGRVAFQVTHLTGGQRFRVVTGDGEVEVRGTRFEVEARDDALWALAVTEGKVDLHLGEVVLRLQAGDEWRRQQPSPVVEGAGAVAQASAAMEEPAPVSEPLRGHEPSGGSPARSGSAVPAERAKPTPGSKGRESFDLGWSHLRHGQWDAAIHSFAAVAAQAQGQALEEDALYWQAVATARAGRAQEASALFEAFLHRFQTGARTGAATLALAWLRFDAGETDKARVLFERAAHDSSARVRESAQEGLRRLRSR